VHHIPEIVGRHHWEQQSALSRYFAQAIDRPYSIGKRYSKVGVGPVDLFHQTCLPAVEQHIYIAGQQVGDSGSKATGSYNPYGLFYLEFGHVKHL